MLHCERRLIDFKEYFQQDLISRGGQSIYPAEVEYFLHTHPKIQDVQVGNYNKNLLNLSETGRPSQVCTAEAF